MKKIIILAIIIIIILISIAGVFLWRQSREDVKVFNKDLPQGIRVVKSLVGNSYKVVNEIDGYEFRVPQELKGLKKIKYSRRDVPSLSIQGTEGARVGIGCYELKTPDINLESWVKDWTSYFDDFVWATAKEKVGNMEVIRVKEEEYLAGVAIYFFRDYSKIYGFSSVTGDFFQDIFLNGRW